MNQMSVMSVIMNELEPYFLQKTFFAMLINYSLNRKYRKISAN